MDSSPMDDLEARLEELVGLLAAHGERYWTRRMTMALEGVRANRLGGISQVLGTYGGEGTFSDLRLGGEDAAHEELANRQLGRLRDRIYRLADDLANGTAGG